MLLTGQRAPFLIHRSLSDVFVVLGPHDDALRPPAGVFQSATSTRRAGSIPTLLGLEGVRLSIEARFLRALSRGLESVVELGWKASYALKGIQDSVELPPGKRQVWAAMPWSSELSIVGRSSSQISTTDQYA